MITVDMTLFVFICVFGIMGAIICFGVLIISLWAYVDFMICKKQMKELSKDNSKNCPDYIERD